MKFYLIFLVLLCTFFHPHQVSARDVIESHETTFIQGYLDKDSQRVDYVSYINDMQQKDVTPKNNAITYLIRAYGIDRLKQKIDAPKNKTFTRNIGLKNTKDLGADCLFDAQQMITLLAKEDIKNGIKLSDKQIEQYRLKKIKETVLFDRLMDHDENLKKSNDQLLLEMHQYYKSKSFFAPIDVFHRSWQGKDFPDHLKWVNKNNKALDLFVKSSDASSFYWPTIIDANETLLDRNNDHISMIWSFLGCLEARARLRIGSGDLEGAARDSFAMIKMGRLVGQINPVTAYEYLSAIALESRGISILHVLSRSKHFNIQVYSKIINTFKALPPRKGSTVSIQTGERIVALDMLFHLLKGSFELKDLGIDRLDDQTRGVFEINIALRRINQHYDNLVRQAKRGYLDEIPENVKVEKDFLKKLEARLKIKEKVSQEERHVASESLADLLFRKLVPSIPTLMRSNNKASMKEQVLKLGMALELYKKKEGGYPKRLSDIVQQFGIEKLPIDLYDEKQTPLKYRVEPSGKFIIWSNDYDGVNDKAQKNADGQYHGNNDYVFDIGNWYMTNSDTR